MAAGKQYWGSQTEKAAKNFPFDFRKTHREVIYSIVEIKKAAARAHMGAKELDRVRAGAIEKACDEILKGKHEDQFPLPSFQGGMGTSNHMNVNEVIANRATEILGKRTSPSSLKLRRASFASEGWWSCRESNPGEGRKSRRSTMIADLGFSTLRDKRSAENLWRLVQDFCAAGEQAAALSL